MSTNGKQPMAVASSSKSAAIELDTIDDPSIRFLSHSQRTGTLYQGDTWEGQELNVLTLDGGGIRGYWTLRVLEMLMFYIEKAEMDYDGPDPDPRNPRPDLRDRSVQRWKGTHSFWPEDFPNHVSHKNSDEDDSLHKLSVYEDWANEAHASNSSPEEMQRFHPARRFLPCHYFDYIAGTSTGALIAIMLGRFRMTVTDCLQEYRTLGDKVFGNPRILHKNSKIPLIIGPNKFSAETLEKVLKDFEYRRTEERDHYAGPVTFPTRPGLCKSLVVTLRDNPDGTAETTYLIRSYRHMIRPPKDPRPLPFGEAQNFRTWEVARAATAAPTIFKKIKIWHQPSREKKERKKLKAYHVFSDGGFNRVNNPTEEAYKDIKELHGDQVRIGVMVSVGTAKAVEERFGGSLFGIAKKAVALATDVEKVAQDMLLKAQQPPTFDYFRLNENKNGCKVKLDEWKPSGLRQILSKKCPGQDTLKAIDDCFERWYPRHQQMLQECATRLVDIRRKRVLNRSRWERYATGAHYYCDEKNCEADFQYRQLFNIHLHGHYQRIGQRLPEIDDENEDMEDDLPPDLQKKLKKTKHSRRDHMDRCRTQWQYPEYPIPAKGRHGVVM